MRLYSGLSRQFIEDTRKNQIAEKLKQAFFNYFRYYPSPNEVNSWRNSLRPVSDAISYGELEETGIILEYQLPQSSRRIDVLLCGLDNDHTPRSVITELKQWDTCEKSESNLVMTWTGGGNREVLHPSAQVGQYCQYLQDAHTAFYGEDAIALDACSYLHNYHPVKDDPVLDEQYQPLLQSYPLFMAEDVDEYIVYLRDRLSAGYGGDILARIESSKYRPSKKLMDHVGNIIKNKSEYILLDEQLVAYDKVLTLIKQGFHHKNTHVVIVKGGPGTGKSVIALNLMADLLIAGYNAQHATGSKAFTETLRMIMGSRGSVQFRYFNSYIKSLENEIDVLILDEAHRLRENSNNRFTKKADRSDVTQIEELLKSGKVLVFFIDDDQIVRPNEIGSVEYIKEHAQRCGAEVHEYELESQFRCSGSDAFVNWINNTLGIKRTANPIWDGDEEFEFKVFASPLELEEAIRAKAQEGYTARVTAGFCWEWSKALAEDGTLIEDIKIGDYERPWNARPEMTGLPKDVPKASFWAHDPNGINQVGCIYTAQGFEFDYVGVIFGDDLVYDMDRQEWVGVKENSADTTVKRSGGQFIDLVKNTYRVLLTRGMKGCYVYFMDDETRKLFLSRMEIGSRY